MGISAGYGSRDLLCCLRKPNDSVGGSGMEQRCLANKEAERRQRIVWPLAACCMHFSGSTVQPKIYAAVMSLTTHGTAQHVRRLRYHE